MTMSILRFKDENGNWGEMVVHTVSVILKSGVDIVTDWWLFDCINHQ